MTIKLKDSTINIVGEYMKLLNYDNVLDQVLKKNRIWRLIAVCIGCFIVALIYNAYVVPNNIVYGGIGGLAILVMDLTGLPTTIFINVVTGGLIILSIFLLGIKKTSYSIVGYLVYAVMINITLPLSKFISFEFDSFLFSIAFYAIITGFGYGLIYRTGFNTGGSDTIVCIMQKYFRFPTAKLSNILNGVIIIIGASTFGIVKSIYAIVFLKLCNAVSDYVILGSSNHKICFIKTKYNREVEELLTEELEIGYTLIDSTNGIGLLKKRIIMCVIPTDRFYDLKKDLLAIDKKARLISNDCYTVEGGITNSLIPI